MSYSASYSGGCRNFPGLRGLVSPQPASLSDADLAHVDHASHLVEHYLDENVGLNCSLSVSGHCDGQGTGSLNISISLSPPAPVEVEQAPTDAAPVESPAAEDAPAQTADGTQPDAAQADPPPPPAEPAGEVPAAV